MQHCQEGFWGQRGVQHGYGKVAKNLRQPLQLCGCLMRSDRGAATDLPVGAMGHTAPHKQHILGCPRVNAPPGATRPFRNSSDPSPAPHSCTRSDTGGLSHMLDPSHTRRVAHAPSPSGLLHTQAARSPPRQAIAPPSRRARCTHIPTRQALAHGQALLHTPSLPAERDAPTPPGSCTRTFWAGFCTCSPR